MVDQIANFKKVTVSTGYDAAATSIVLESGHGAELPDPSGDNYNLVWWDSTNYPDPADDPNVEIVRVTAKSTDTLTVTRNQEGSGASTKNTGSATYLMILSITANTITDLIADVERTATVIVGKSGHVDYLTTDYGSDGACILAAVNYVNGLGGGSVLIREGTYTISNLVTLQSNIWIFGVGDKTIIQSNKIGDLFSANSESNIHLSNMQFDGNSNASSPIAIYTSTGVKLSDLYIHDVGTGTPDNVYGCYIEDCTDVVVSDCIIDTVDRDGIQLKGCTNNIISGCILKACDYYGIDCHDSATPKDMKNTIISDCVIDACARGIDINTGNNWTVQNCNIRDSTILGIDIRATCDHVVIDNVTIYNSANGHIDLYNATAITNITISNCVFDTTTVASKDGIYAKNVTDGIISNCIIKNSTRHGIYSVTPITIHSCIVNDNGTNGIYLESSNCLVNGNVCDNNGDRGIREYTGHNNNTIINNITRNNTSGAMLFVGADTIVRDNIGYNPFGAVGPPSVPATTVNYTNAYGYPCQVQVYGGTVTEIDIDDIATGLTSGIFMIPPGGTINITYSAAPSWRWWGL